MDIIDRLRIEAKREPHEPIWRDAITEIERLRGAIHACLDYANNRQSEWGSRAETAFEFLENATSS